MFSSETLTLTFVRTMRHYGHCALILEGMFWTHFYVIIFFTNFCISIRNYGHCGILGMQCACTLSITFVHTLEIVTTVFYFKGECFRLSNVLVLSH